MTNIPKDKLKVFEFEFSRTDISEKIIFVSSILYITNILPV